MKRTTVAILVLALGVGALIAPAEAAKKKKKKKVAPPVVELVASESKFFLRWPDDGTGACAPVSATYMTVVEGEKSTTCSDAAQVAQEAFAAANQALVTYNYPAREGVPLTLDASRKLKGELVLRGTVTAQAYVQLKLTGTIDGAEVTLAEGETGKANGALSNSAATPVGGIRQDLPGPAAVVPVDLAIDAAFDKKQVTALTLTAVIRGVHRGGFDYDRTPSHIIVPTFI